MILQQKIRKYTKDQKYLPLPHGVELGLMNIAWDRMSLSLGTYMWPCGCTRHAGACIGAKIAAELRVH